MRLAIETYSLEGAQDSQMGAILADQYEKPVHFRRFLFAAYLLQNGTLKEALRTVSHEATFPIFSEKLHDLHDRQLLDLQLRQTEAEAAYLRRLYVEKLPETIAEQFRRVSVALDECLANTADVYALLRPVICKDLAYTIARTFMELQFRHQERLFALEN